MKVKSLLAIFIVILFPILSSAQDQAKRAYTRADFINVDGGSLTERFDKAYKQFKDSKQGDSVWIAYHFPVRDGVSVGPFSGMMYYDEGIRLEKRSSAANAAVFLLVDASGSQARITKMKLLDLTDPYVFEERRVYWLGDVDASQSISLIEKTMQGDKENKDLFRGGMRAISVHNNPRVVTILKDLAAKETNPDIQRSAISNLSSLRSSESLEALINLYESSAIDSLKEEIINGIGRDTSRQASDKLLSIAKNDPNPKMRQRAIRRLSAGRNIVSWN